jgi:hypothetical protein
MSWSREGEAVLRENHSLVWEWLSRHLAGQSVQRVQNWGLWRDLPLWEDWLVVLTMYTLYIFVIYFFHHACYFLIARDICELFKINKSAFVCMFRYRTHCMSIRLINKNRIINIIFHFFVTAKYFSSFQLFRKWLIFFCTLDQLDTHTCILVLFYKLENLFLVFIINNWSFCARLKETTKFLF